MKFLFRAVIIAVVATGLATSPAWAQAAPAAADTNKAPAVAKPAAAPKKDTVAKPKAGAKGATQIAVKKPEPKPAPVYHPEPATARQANVNIRGQAMINSEVVGHLKKGDAITVLEEITLKKPKQDEPAKWYRVILPSTVGVWVHSSFLDGTTVKATELNMRGGPGEEYSVLGRLPKGSTIKQLEAKGDWSKIEAPTNAHGFVAAHLLEKKPIEIAAAPVEPKKEITPAPPTTEAVKPPTTVVEPTPPVVTPSVPPPAITDVPPVVPPTTPVLPDAPIEKVRKIVNREGILKGSFSIQAPAYFELRALDTGKTINYVFSPSTNLVLRQYKGQRIIVTGEELLDERWQNTPVIIIDSLQTVP